MNELGFEVFRRREAFVAVPAGKYIIDILVWIGRPFDCKTRV